MDAAVTIAISGRGCQEWRREEAATSLCPRGGIPHHQIPTGEANCSSFDFNSTPTPISFHTHQIIKTQLRRQEQLLPSDSVAKPSTNRLSGHYSNDNLLARTTNSPGIEAALDPYLPTYETLTRYAGATDRSLLRYQQTPAFIRMEQNVVTRLNQQPQSTRLSTPTPYPTHRAYEYPQIIHLFRRENLHAIHSNSISMPPVRKGGNTHPLSPI